MVEVFSLEQDSGTIPRADWLRATRRHRVQASVLRCVGCLEFGDEASSSVIACRYAA